MLGGEEGTRTSTEAVGGTEEPTFSGRAGRHNVRSCQAWHPMASSAKMHGNISNPWSDWTGRGGRLFYGNFPPRRPWRSAPVLRRVSSPRPERGATPARSPWRSGGRRRPTAARVPTPGGACPPAGSSGGAGALATMPCVFPIRSWRPTPCMPRWQPLSTPYRSCVRLWKLMTVIAWDIVALCVLSYMEGCQHGQ
jgi:hypothetical protein